MRVVDGLKTRGWAACAVLAAVCTVAAGCGTAGDDNGASGGDVTIEYWTFSEFTTGEQGDIVKGYINEFETANPGIKIELVGKPAEDIVSGTVTNAGQGTGADVISTQMNAGSSLVYAGLLKDISEEWAAAGAGYTDQFDKDFVDLMGRNDGRWGVPYTAYVTVLYRNLNVLRQAGIDPDQPIDGWDGWLDQMKQVHDAGFAGMADPFQSGAERVIQFYAGIPSRTQFDLKDDLKSLLLDQDALEQAIAFCQATKEFGSDVAMDTQGEVDLFNANQLAFLPGGPWKYWSFIEADGVEFDIQAIPGKAPGATGGVRGGEFLAITADSEHPAEAWKFVQFMTDQAQLARFTVPISRITGNAAAMQDAAVLESPLNRVSVEAFPGGVNESPLQRQLPPGIAQVFADGLVDADTGMPAKEAAAAIIKNYNAALAG
ncbi:MAG: extracellular solute-binding protein [Bifidobacteriaceae bacterium]|jgi:multiple sugar transport system substrate-binding protein|nr:extracellular solute-binding protein [Bifidobacteriaceae bacterium]